MFDFSVVDTTDDDCEQQIPSVALRLQQLTTQSVRLMTAGVVNCTVYCRTCSEFQHVIDR